MAANVKKNINKLKAQAQAMISTEENVPEEVNEDEEMSDEDEDESEEYPIQKIGWKCLSSFSTNYIHEHITSLSMYLSFSRFQLVIKSLFTAWHCLSVTKPISEKAVRKKPTNGSSACGT